MPLLKTRRKVSLWKQLTVGEVPMGAAAECVGRTTKPERWQEDHKCLSRSPTEVGKWVRYGVLARQGDWQDVTLICTACAAK